MTNLLNKLRGGDLRSIGKADEVARQVLENSDLFSALFQGLYSNDPVVRMRAADAVEKVSRQRPGLLKGYSAEIIAILESSDQQEVCWHMAQIAPRLHVEPREEEHILVLLKKLLSHKSRIVQVSAMDALTAFAERDETLANEVKTIIMEQMKNGAPSIIARGRKLLKRLERENKDA